MLILASTTGLELCQSLGESTLTQSIHMSHGVVTLWISPSCQEGKKSKIHKQKCAFYILHSGRHDAILIFKKYLILLVFVQEIKS
jgi:hypothetical protein